MKQKIMILTAAVIGLLLCSTACRETEPKSGKAKTQAVKTVKKAPEVKPEVVYASEIPLFDKGQTSWQVVIPVEASEVNKYAAEEFVTAIKKIAGVEIPVVYADDLQPGNNIVIGSLKDNPYVTRMAGFLNLGDVEDNDTIGVHTIAGNLYLVGNNPRSAAYAVYHFLREYLGVRWFWPGADGEYMPKRETFKIPEIAYNYQAPIRYRAASPVGNHGDPMIETGTFRMFTNGERINGKISNKTGAIRVVGTHSVGLHSKDFDKYPECFAMINGERTKLGDAGCWTNPKFLEMMVEKHTKWAEKNKADLICAFASDTILRCQCPECTKVKNKSSRWYIFYEKMVKEIRKKVPNLRAATIAYQEYRAVPDVPVDLEYVEYCLYNRCYVHEMDDPDCEKNKKALAEIKRWQEKAPMGIYGYEFDVFDKRMYLPIHNQLAKTAKFFRNMNVVRLKTEFPAVRAGKNQGREYSSYVPRRLSGYTFCITAWNPDLDINDIVRDFCNYVYGAGADAMYEYHTTVAKYWDEMDVHPTYFGAVPDSIARIMWNPQRLRAMKKLFMDAEKAIAAMPDEAARKRAADDLFIDRFYFDEWERYYYLAQTKLYTLNLPKCDPSFDFDKMNVLPVTDKNGVQKNTDVRMFWSDEALHFRVICKDAGVADVPKGSAGRDIDLTKGASIAFSLDLNDGNPFRYFGVNLAGGTFDALGEDTSWNPEWKAVLKLNKQKDQWMLEATLPFESLGVPVPKDGTQWKISIIRNAAGKQTEDCGFPTAIRDLDEGSAVLNFSENAKPGKVIAFIHNDPKQDARVYRLNRSALMQNGWQPMSINGVEGLQKADLSGANLIQLTMYQFKLPVELFREKILPVVENGAVVYFNVYYWTGNIPKYFDDPTLKIDFKDYAAGVRSYTWITETSFATTPRKFKNSHTPPGVLYPANPDRWEVLAKQKDRDGVERPALVCTPYGKGLIVVAGDLYYMYQTFLENIIEYNKVVKR